MISRVVGSPVAHRILAFCLALAGGHSLGQALRATGSGPLLDFAPLYVGSWMIRDGRPWADLYDPAHLSGAVSQLAPAGRIVDLGATPPALVLLTYPFTWFTPEYGKFLFAAGGVLVLILGLFALGAGRALGWNRSEWIALAGIVLGSVAAEESVLRGGAAPWVFGGVAAAVAAHALGNRWSAAVLSGLAANLGAAGWGPLVFSLWRGPRGPRLLALAVTAAGLSLQAAALGPRGIALFGTAWLRTWDHPGASDASWVGRARRVAESGTGSTPPPGPGTPSGSLGDAAAENVGSSGALTPPEATAVTAGAIATGLVLLVLVLLLLVLLRELGRDRVSWLAADPEGARRLNFDPPRLLGVGPALLAGLFLLGVPEPFRGHGLLWGIPLWAAVGRLESRPAAGSGLVLLLLALLLLVPVPLSGWLGPNTRANLVALASTGLLLWWVWEFHKEAVAASPVVRRGEEPTLSRR